MSKSKERKRAEKAKKRTVERRNRRHRYSPKPSAPKPKRRPWPLPDTPPTAHETQRGAEALIALLLMGARSSRRSMPWIGREYWKGGL